MPGLAEAAGVSATAAAPVAAAPAAGAVAVAPAPAAIDPAAAAASATAAGAATGYRPDGIPDHLAGPDDKTTIDNLWKAADGFRKAEGERGAVPKDPAGYAFEPSEKIKPFVGDLANDGFFKGVKEAALAAGVTDKQFPKFINNVMEKMLDSGMVKPVDYAKEMAALLPEAAKSLDDAGRKAAVGARISENLAFIEGARKQGMPEDVATALTARLGDDAVGNKAIEWIRAQAREIKPAMGGKSAGGVSEADLDARVADPRNDPNSSKFDKGFAEETRKQFMTKFGN